jgi:hypothetical protein
MAIRKKRKKWEPGRGTDPEDIDVSLKQNAV